MRLPVALKTALAIANAAQYHRGVGEVINFVFGGEGCLAGGFQTSINATDGLTDCARFHRSKTHLAPPSSIKLFNTRTMARCASSIMNALCL
jgi:hypothetical protein